jgi:hypothetical protein
MTYSPTHPFERAADGGWCGAPDPADRMVCARPAEHPIHAVDRPEIEELARALASRQWRTEPVSLAQTSEHRRHSYSSDCALCKGDAHAIAAFVLEMLGVSE